MTIRNGANKKGNKARGGGLAPRMDGPVLVYQMMNVESVLETAPLNLKNLSNQCLLLSKILDSLVANNRRPNYRHDLLLLAQQVCKYKDKPEVRPALLVLLLSIKSAFRTDWLSTLEVSGNGEIFATLNLLFDSFTTSHEDLAQASLQSLQCGGSAVKEPLEAMNFLLSISDRFYPRLQLSGVFVAVQAKVGYEVLVCDFHLPHIYIEDRVRLYVSKNDSIEAATCLITPPQVNILVNGQQVEKRVTTGFLDVCPQMPSDVTDLVKVGANVLQVIGEFSGSYVIAVASSRTIKRSAKDTHPEDYVSPTESASSEVDPTEVDDEVVEGASRLSLRCPISHQRLVTPVKATTCRHLQCFDYDSFLEINEKRPAWRCPCCNRFTSWPDLRIDRKMEKVLKETDENIHEVIVSQDGSWVPVSTGGNQSNSGSDMIPVEGCEVGSKVTDLSHIPDEELNEIRQNSNEIQLPERKPDKQTLLAINENTVPGTAETPVHSQSATSAQPPPVANDNSQGSNAQSRIGFHSNTQQALLMNTGPPHSCSRPELNNQHLVQPQQQWRGPGVSPHQLTTNTAQIQNLQPGGATALEQNWRPGTICMRGRIVNPSVGRGVLGPSPSALQQRCAVNYAVPQHSD